MRKRNSLQRFWYDWGVVIIILVAALALVMGLLALYDVGTEETDDGFNYRIEQIEGMDCVFYRSYHVGGLTCDWDMRKR
jgi:hypothetical protein